MEWALHDPQTGYYARRISGVGKRGDFTTAPMISDLPARAIAKWAAAAMRETGCRHLIEIGPGEGKLAAGVLQNLPWFTRIKTRFHRVETSVPLAQLQQKRLGKQATWHRDMRDALAACEGKAVIFSNELVDAFPVRRFQKTPEGWQEMGVTQDPDGKMWEILLPVARLPESSAFAQPFKTGQIVEIHESYRNWLTQWIPHWKTGRLLTIDYGAEIDRLYHRRPAGTLRAYLLQQRLEGPLIYGNPGRQDLTADVNFSDLMTWGEHWSASPRLTSFRKFLKPFADLKNPADLALLDETGAGGAFQVLDQKRSC